MNLIPPPPPFPTLHVDFWRGKSLWEGVKCIAYMCLIYDHCAME